MCIWKPLSIEYSCPSEEDFCWGKQPRYCKNKKMVENGNKKLYKPMSSAKPPTGRRHVPVTNCNNLVLCSLSKERTAWKMKKKSSYCNLLLTRTSNWISYYEDPTAQNSHSTKALSIDSYFLNSETWSVIFQVAVLMNLFYLYGYYSCLFLGLGKLCFCSK